MTSIDPDPYSIGLTILSQLIFNPEVILISGCILICLLLSGIISGSEVAFFALTSSEIDACRKGESKKEQAIHKLLQHPKRLLASILIANNLVNITAVTLTTYLSWIIGPHFGYSKEYSMPIAGFIITILLVFIGEIIPKVYANEKGLQFALYTVKLIKYVNTTFTPLSNILIGFTNIIEKRIDKKGYDISVDDLQEAIGITTENDETSNEERDILLGIANFGTISVTQVMRSRLDVTAFDISSDFHKLMDKINKSGFSRIPIFENSIDNIKGVLYIKDLLPHIQKKESFNWTTLIRPAYFIPENKKIDDLLKSFQEKRVHMAIVVDEYGGTSGIITLEDVIEEIVGEINDEFDTDDIEYEQIDNTNYIFEGKTSINDLIKILDLKSDTFEDVKGEQESLGGLLLEANENLPNVGEKINIKDFEFTIESVNSKRIKRAKITLPYATKNDH